MRNILRTNDRAAVTPHGMITMIVVIFVLAILGAVFTTPLQDQITSWSANLTTNGQTAAAAVVNLIPLLFWVLLAVGMILTVVGTFIGGGEHGL